MITAERYHDISCGHRVVGHEGKCRFLHGHNYRIHFEVAAEELDEIGRVLDFSVIKEKLCMWLEDHYDHKFLIWSNDPMLEELQKLTAESLVIVPFNPTAENIAKHLVEVVAPQQLQGTSCRLIRCKVEETQKCSATYKK
ncbi:6-pyruvoyltetrahydropterin/6-carboxytetrahydropterin synthase [Sphingobacterium alimentarium]|uniref:6-carboxy-5,6,7,8-tetrahydropterin synthase n=1 Tax=Sphingobacterium alimentarium TaxID=797292 RepID=A0A4V2VU96_9SPHI|nr:6-carboxytetrahydropterin synthase [Sphingobacterium alimentarium]TCV14073.1 6-pyruvoyltetrahydropterin/6-carboxytetrahydropterin synthase [Sphingobacterium alimentarium]